MYTEVLSPLSSPTPPLDRHKTLRIFCREKPPCGGISVIDHFEVNVVPLHIALTHQFYRTILQFCFPDSPAPPSQPPGPRKRRGAGRGGRRDHTQFYVRLQNDDLEIMKVGFLSFLFWFD